MDIQLSFVNQSQDQSSYVVIGQKNLTDGTVVAWQVIDCSDPEPYDFAYSFTTCLSVEDEWGNDSDLIETGFGQQWNVNRSDDGEDLELESQPASNPNVIQIKNDFLSGAIDSSIYKDGKLLACRLGLAPQQEAVFELDTYLWIGAVEEEIEEGDLVAPSLLTTEISLMGLLSAKIVMTGGGKSPIVFELIPQG